jgi:hypothetical protein
MGQDDFDREEWMSPKKWNWIFISLAVIGVIAFIVSVYSTSYGMV